MQLKIKLKFNLKVEIIGYIGVTLAENNIKNRGYYKYPPNTLSILPTGVSVIPHVDILTI
jgi:hypothetical protein